jgi:hypothetical protein
MSDTPDAIPIEKADAELHAALKRFHRLRWVAFGALIAVLVIAGVTGGTVIYHQQRRLDSQQLALFAGCKFFTDLARLPVEPVAPLTRPSEAVVSIVVDARATAHGLGCPSIPPPSPSLKKWAAYYHIPLGESS